MMNLCVYIVKERIFFEQISFKMSCTAEQALTFVLRIQDVVRKLE